MSEMLKMFQNFRQIHCISPCCGKIHRLSDLHLRSKKPVGKTWLDDYEAKRELIEKKDAKFAEMEEELRKKARKLGSAEAEKALASSLLPQIKRLKINPYDIKPVLHPIDFLVFKGMKDGDAIDEIMMLSKHGGGKELSATRKKIEAAVKKKNYEWKVARVDDKWNIGFE